MNIFISGLSFKASDEDLKQIFSAYGEVSSAKIITDRGSRRSKGYGFVEMPSDADANKAINALNGSEHLGRTLNVSVAREKVERDRSY
ncbi:MAG: RNA-binding protein [Prevotellaceae bacterium]|jgi:RNA recognition motif-containing protein|nr:RNA-binding protein [Prevotellaceae bacterium]